MPRKTRSPDRRPVLLAAVEVGDDRAGADVVSFVEIGVAEIAHVMLPRPRPGASSSSSAKLPTTASGPTCEPGGDGSTARSSRRRRPPTTRRSKAQRQQPGPIMLVDDLQADPERRSGADDVVPRRIDVRLDRRRPPRSSRCVGVDGRGVAHRHQAHMWTALIRSPEVPLGLGELGPVVDAHQPPVVLDGRATTTQPSARQAR